MTIERGGDWGRTGPLPADGVVVPSDADAARVVRAALSAGARPPAIGLLGGDLCRTLGGRGDEARLHRDEATRVPIDIGEVRLDEGPPIPFLAHVVARRSWWRGRVWLAMNAEWLGAWDVAPRAHPGDGLLDILDVTMSTRDRIKARRRALTGTHVPHPSIAEHRATHARLESDSALGVWVDAVRVGEARSVTVRLTGESADVVV